MTGNNIFCWAEKYDDDNSFQQKKYRAFNKEVVEDRYCEIRDLIKDDILKDLKLELNNNSWNDEWKKVTTEQWKRILEIPEADKKIIENIIGFELELKDPKEEPYFLVSSSLDLLKEEEEITVNGKRYKLIK